MSRMCRRQEAFLVLDSSFGMNCVNRFENFFYLDVLKKRKKKKILEVIFFFWCPHRKQKFPRCAGEHSVLKCSPESDHMFLSLSPQTFTNLASVAPADCYRSPLVRQSTSRQQGFPLNWEQHCFLSISNSSWGSVCFFSLIFCGRVWGASAASVIGACADRWALTAVGQVCMQSVS